MPSLHNQSRIIYTICQTKDGEGLLNPKDTTLQRKICKTH